jgi:hypothetical protein
LSQFERQGQVSHFTILSDLSVHPLNPPTLPGGRRITETINTLAYLFSLFLKFRKFQFQSERSLSGSRKPSNQDIRNFVAQQYEQTYEQVGFFYIL